jgi:hypothetical protein
MWQGYSLKKRNFFRYSHYILTLGVLGTLVQFLVMAATIFYVNQYILKYDHDDDDDDDDDDDVYGSDLVLHTFTK